MATFYTGPGGNDAWDGTTWETRKLTIAGGLAAGLSSGDIVYVGPGVYRETATLGGSGEEHSWGTSGKTISVTHNSKIVTGSGTHWLSNGLIEGDVLFVSYLASGSGNVNGAPAGATLTDAGGNFLASSVGMCINMHEPPNGPDGGSFQITGVGGTTVTYNDVNGIGYPLAANNPYNYTVPSGEGSYEIESCESNTQFTLKRPWAGPTYTDIPAETGINGHNWDLWRPMYLIGDETGAHTDGIGGVCRITGSTADVAANRAEGIDTNSQNYWTIKGFQVDTVTNACVLVDGGGGTTGLGITFEDIRTLSPESYHFHFDGAGYRCTVRRTAMFGGDQATGIYLHDVQTRWSGVNHFENIYAACYIGFDIRHFANTTVKNCTNGMSCRYFLQTSSIPIGGCVFITNCEIHYAETAGLAAAVNGQILADWNNFWDNNNDFSNGTEGANCTTYLYIPDLPVLVDTYRYPFRFYPPSEWWAVFGQGLYPANEDIYGIMKPLTDTKLNWGFQQTYHIERNTVTTYGGENSSLEQPDARTTQFRIPISGDPVTVSVFVLHEAGYAGDLPKVVVSQPGQDDVETVGTAATDTWEEITVPFTPGASPPYIWVDLVSQNTAAAASVFWQRLSVIPVVA